MIFLIFTARFCARDLHLISNWKVVTFWGVATWSSSPYLLCDPSLDPMSKTCHNFFSIGRILSKNVLIRKKTFSLSYFPKHFVCLSAPHEISSHLAKNMLFLRKKSIFFAKCDEISWETGKLTKCFGK